MKILSFVLLYVMSGMSFANPFQHHIRSYPKGQLDCHALAKDLAKRFESATGIKVTEALCMAESPHGFDIDLVYDADVPLKVVTTLYQQELYTQRYTDLKTCEAKISAQVTLFEKATGLSPVYAYCYLEQDKSNWSPAITAFGQARRIPFASGYYMFTNPKFIPKEDYLLGLRKALEKHDAMLADIIVHPQIGMSYLTFHYYSLQKLRLSLAELTATPKQEQCEAQKEELSRMLATTDNGPFSTYCGYVDIPASWELNLAFVDTPSFTWRSSLERFKDFDTCQKEKGSVTQKYQENQKNILGGFCSKEAETRQFAVVLIKQN